MDIWAETNLKEKNHSYVFFLNGRLNLSQLPFLEYVLIRSIYWSTFRVILLEKHNKKLKIRRRSKVDKFTIDLELRRLTRNNFTKRACKNRNSFSIP